MDIKNFFSGMFGGGQNVLHTPYGDLHLAKSSDRKRVKKMVIELERTTDALTRRDIADWRQAWQMAINVDSPNRQRLYDIYRDVEIDLHLSGCVRQRVGFVMAKSFKLVDAKGNEDEEAHHYFDQSWFKQLLEYALAANNWGHSLIELGDLTTDGDGCVCYTDVKLISRKHVIPEYGRVIQQLGQDWTSGIDYRSAPFTDWLIEAGRPDDLGLYLKAATQTIPKKNMLAFWDSFGEISVCRCASPAPPHVTPRRWDDLNRCSRVPEQASTWWQDRIRRLSLWRVARAMPSMSMTNASIAPTRNCQSSSSGRR